MSVMSDRVLALLEYLNIDPTSDGLHEQLLRALLDPAERLSLIAHGDGTTILEGWAAITDPQVAPLWALPHAAQWTGGIMPARQADETDDAYLTRARADVVSPRGMRRASPASILVVARRYLTGTQTARMAEHLDDDPWMAAVQVRVSEVPDEPALLEGVNDPDVVPAGAKVIVQHIAPGDVWNMAEIESAYFGRSMGDLEGDFATMNDVETYVP